jgi:hypothetical protein
VEEWDNHHGVTLMVLQSKLGADLQILLSYSEWVMPNLCQAVLKQIILWQIQMGSTCCTQALKTAI